MNEGYLVCCNDAISIAYKIKFESESKRNATVLINIEDSCGFNVIGPRLSTQCAPGSDKRYEWYLILDYYSVQCNLTDKLVSSKTFDKEWEFYSGDDQTNIFQWRSNNVPTSMFTFKTRLIIKAVQI